MLFTTPTIFILMMMESHVEFQKLPSGNVYESLKHQKLNESLNESALRRKTVRYLDPKDENIVDAVKQIVEEVTKPSKERMQMFAKFQIQHNCLGNLKISMFWEEKLIIFIQALQFLGVILTAFYEQFPKVYRKYLVIFLGSVLNFPYIISYDKAITTFSAGFYGVVASSAVIVVCSLPAIFYFFSRDFYEKAIKLPLGYKKFYFTLIYLLVTPGILNCTQYALCFFQSSVPGIVLVKCWSDPKIYIVWGLGIASYLVIIADIVIIIYLTYPNIVYNTNIEQEKFVKTKEIEYSFNLSKLWERNFFFLFSSFKKQKLAPYYRVINIISQMLIVIMYNITVVN
jgi:hypothetical protein